MFDQIAALANELETEARVAGANRYVPGQVGFEVYVRHYLAESAARRIIALEERVAELETTTPAGAVVPLRAGVAGTGSSRLADAAPAGEKEAAKQAASHAERGVT